MKTELDKEQSQHLIDLGVSKEKASGIIKVFDEDGTLLYTLPIFKLEDLLNGEVLPNTIDGNRAHRTIQTYDGYHYAFYSYDYGRISNLNEAEELIDSLYQLTCWYYGEYKK